MLVITLFLGFIAGWAFPFPMPGVWGVCNCLDLLCSHCEHGKKSNLLT